MIVVVGSVNVDHVVVAPALPVAGQTVVGSDLALHGGGKGANAAVAAVRLGARVRLVAAVGDDELGAGAVADLAEEGIDVSGVQRLAGVPTGAALIVVSADGENQIAVAPGANARLEVDAAALAGAAVVLVSCEVPLDAVAAAVRAGREAGATVVLNPAPVLDGVLELAPLGPLLTPNRGEAAQLSGRDDPEAAALALSERTGAPVVVTLGADGTLVAVDGAVRRHAAVRVQDVVDTTGAGDTFNGALAAGLARGRALEDAVGDALRAAGESVRHAGARAGMPRA